jgi:hypothetical protein
MTQENLHFFLSMGEDFDGENRRDCLSLQGRKRAAEISVQGGGIDGGSGGAAG